jgi:hypothetical protein
MLFAITLLCLLSAGIIAQVEKNRDGNLLTQISLYLSDALLGQRAKRQFRYAILESTLHLLGALLVQWVNQKDINRPKFSVASIRCTVESVCVAY